MKRKSWRDPTIYLRKIHVDEGCLEDSYTQEIIKRAGLPVEVVPAGSQPKVSDHKYPESLTEGKRHLFLTRNRGDFFKPCPATREYRCCDYHVLNTGMNCPIDCVYCILQAYLNNPWISFYVNTDDMFAEIDQVLTGNPDKLYRIGTGEFTDSLAIDRLTRLSEKLVEYMAGKVNGMLELKTKSGMIDNLENLDHNERTVVAWSLNSSQILSSHELRAATLEERLEAARQCAEWGYRLAFHFDPIIDHDDWQAGYGETIDRLFQVVPADKIVWISLGALRYLPALKETGLGRFPGSRIFFQEFIEGLDGKSRYFRARRVELYKYMYQRLNRYAHPDTCIYFCMESDEIWNEVMGFAPLQRGGVPAMLDRAFFDRQ